MTKLEKASHEYACKAYYWAKNALPTLLAARSFREGAKWKEENLWHDAQGDDLPEIDREVIVLCNTGHGGYKVAFGHRPNPEGWDGRNILTDEVTHYTPQIYDKGGWNIPDVRWWLDCELPDLE